MPAPSFADPSVQSLLSGKEVVVLATIGPEGAPLAMPMWFVHDARHLAMVSVDGLAKVRNLERDPRLCVVAEGGVRGAIHGVVLHGEAAFLTGPEREQWGRRFHVKYAPEVERLWGGPDLPANRRVFRIAPRVTSAWGLG